MSFVVCKLERCPYYGEVYCKNRLVSIDDNGMCEQIWRRGRQRARAFMPIEDYAKEQHVIEDAVLSQQEPERFHQITVDEIYGGQWL